MFQVKINFREILSCLFIFGAASYALCQSGGNWRAEVKEFRSHLNGEYRDSAQSPLSNTDLKYFRRHKFFPAKKEYAVAAKLVRTPKENPFEMLTSSGKTKLFVKYGELHFVLAGSQCTLSVYQNLKLAEKAEYRNHLFLPFKDATSGNISYGAGRYIDLEIPAGDSLMLDFNKCYNPFCAYSTGWNCPIVPECNFLSIPVKAGIKGAWSNEKKAH